MASERTQEYQNHQAYHHLHKTAQLQEGLLLDDYQQGEEEVSRHRRSFSVRKLGSTRFRFDVGDITRWFFFW